jgi:CheY-like chemotaxis protein
MPTPRRRSPLTFFWSGVRAPPVMAVMIERRQPRLLVIDDDPPVRSVPRDLLSGLGYEVDDASGGAEGLALFRHGGYDLVLTDLGGMSGWEVAEAFDRYHPGRLSSS